VKVGIFGGTFNPPHIGHVLSAMTAANQLALDLLLVVPIGQPPHKTLPPGTPSADVRLFMMLTAFWNVQNTIVSNIEVKSSGPSYTIDTVMSFQQIYPDAQFFLLVGTDMFLTLETWKDADKLLKIVTPAVFSRGYEDRKRISEYSLILSKRYGAETKIVMNDIVEISSSELREMLQNREGARYIADTNYSYIIKNKLYGAKPDWEWLRKRAYSMLSPLRIPHVAGCEEVALRLAERWGVDRNDAQEAAILHDITKRLGLEANLRILEDRGVKIGKLEFAEEKLLHSKSGALLAKDVFGVTDAVADAIMWHTTGRARMSDLEKVIYIADYIEPTRDFPGVETLRELAYNNLDEAMKMGLMLSVSDMKDRGITPDRATFDALGDLNEKGSCT